MLDTKVDGRVPPPVVWAIEARTSVHRDAPAHLFSLALPFVSSFFVVSFLSYYCVDFVMSEAGGRKS